MMVPNNIIHFPSQRQISFQTRSDPLPVTPDNALLFLSHDTQCLLLFKIPYSLSLCSFKFQAGSSKSRHERSLADGLVLVVVDIAVVIIIIVTVGTRNCRAQRTTQS